MSSAVTWIPESLVSVSCWHYLYFWSQVTVSAICTWILVLLTRQEVHFPCLGAYANLQYCHPTLAMPLFPFCQGRQGFFGGRHLEVCSVPHLACLDLFKCSLSAALITVQWLELPLVFVVLLLLYFLLTCSIHRKVPADCSCAWKLEYFSSWDVRRLGM